MSDPVASTNSAAGKPPGHDIFCTPDNSDFVSKVPYKSLSKTDHEIRLLKILPNSGSGFVECELLPPVSLATVHNQYLALSYCAGSAENTKTIKVNGVNFNAFANLHHALTSARHYWETHAELPEFLLWVDQICINQFDLEERSHQVDFMRDIYYNAKRTLICLSISETDGEGMRWLAELKDMMAQNTRPQLERIVFEASGTEWFEKALVGFYDILASPWWGRAWVFQEFMVSMHATFLYGVSAMPHHYFDEIATKTHSELQRGMNIKYPQDRTEKHLTQPEFLRIIHENGSYSGNAISLLEAKRRDPAPSDLESLLTITERCEATDKRDKIYSVLGIANPGYGIKPDYSPQMDITKLLVETTKKIITFEDSLSILWHLLIPCSWPDQSVSVPSWAINWYSGCLSLCQHIPKPTMGYFTDLKITAGSIDASFVDVPHPERTETSITTLQVWAILLDTSFKKVIESKAFLPQYEGSRHYMIETQYPVENDQELWVLCGADQPLLLSRYSYGYRICLVPSLDCSTNLSITGSMMDFPEFMDDQGVYDTKKMDWKKITIF